jgi:putative modified peptide
MEQPGGRRPRQKAHLSIHDDEAREVLERLATDDEFRAQVESNPRAVLLEHRIDVSEESIPATITLPPKEEIESFIQTHLPGPGEAYGYLGFAILYWVLGAMPLVVADADGAG